ncbi:hypothetical protein [Vibrio taketomensis]|uniref:hypothetical protein n=1 Tax=Vibrio taketomensis TaxID=2572923 RepID=UPI001E625180|nr:hypothetical protein [Vibrio taketomensis]
MIDLLLEGVRMAGRFFTKRQELKAKRRERQDRIEEAVTNAQTARIAQGDMSAAELDKISITQRGWKDDYLLVLTTLPIILAFVPTLAPFVGAGFKALANNVPEYYWYALGMVYIDTFGFRRMLRVAIENWLEKRAKAV